MSGAKNMKNSIHLQKIRIRIKGFKSNRKKKKILTIFDMQLVKTCMVFKIA